MAWLTDFICQNSIPKPNGDCKSENGSVNRKSRLYYSQGWRPTTESRSTNSILSTKLTTSKWGEFFWLQCISRFSCMSLPPALVLYFSKFLKVQAKLPKQSVSAGCQKNHRKGNKMEVQQQSQNDRQVVHSLQCNKIHLEAICSPLLANLPNHTLASGRWARHSRILELTCLDLDFLLLVWDQECLSLDKDLHQVIL